MFGWGFKLIGLSNSDENQHIYSVYMNNGFIHQKRKDFDQASGRIQSGLVISATLKSRISA